MRLLKRRIGPPRIGGLETDRPAQGTAALVGNRLPQLLGETKQRRPCQALDRHHRGSNPTVAVWTAEQTLDHLPKREDRQQRDDVSERLVECRLLRQPRLRIPGPEAIQQRMRRLVRDHIV